LGASDGASSSSAQRPQTDVIVDVMSMAGLASNSFLNFEYGDGFWIAAVQLRAFPSNSIKLPHLLWYEDLRLDAVGGCMALRLHCPAWREEKDKKQATAMRKLSSEAIQK